MGDSNKNVSLKEGRRKDCHISDLMLRPRASAASRSMLQLSPPSVCAGASFEAASRRLRTRGLGVTKKFRPVSGAG
jgi:hypothetical protein